MTTDVDKEAILWLPVAVQKEPETLALAALAKVPLFSALKPRHLKKILRLLHERLYQPGETIFRQGDVGAGMFVIVHGTVDVVIKVGNGERVIAKISDGQFFGEMALIQAESRSATCIATSPCRLLGFFEPDFERLIERDVRLGMTVMRNFATLMAARVRTMNESLRG